MFLEKRVYQGSSGIVYPHPIIEKISDEKKDKNYKAVFIENEFLKIMILPELGGRVQMAYDKIKERHFVYYNRVIKPALVGLTGPWISGGIEFNWPQHHRPSTFDPVDYTITANPDGSKTIWVNEVERMFRTKGMAGFTLYPGKAYLEITGKLYNRTPFPQTFLWWANPAVKVDDHYQSVFPPDVHAVYDHGRRDVSSFPVATGTYYKVDYAPGTDISWYKNIPVPTSYMAVASEYDFMGGYEHNNRAGLLHIADHHLAPGKKQWTWGHGEFGKAWDRNLTDEDGPYIELMTGVFTDNQPDFSWIMPNEEKTFSQYFMPYQEVGVVKNASRDAAINLEVINGVIEIKLYVTSAYPRLSVQLWHQGQLLFSDEIAASPSTPYSKSVVPEQPFDATALEIIITNHDRHQELVRYRPEIKDNKEVPQPAAAAKKPLDVETNEQLYLTGLHLEQYRHATWSALDYYQEAVRRDSGDSRNNNAVGLWLLRRGRFNEAEPFFRTAIKTLTERNPNPFNGEAYYNLGWCLKMQGRLKEAFDAFYKAAWNDAWQHTAYLNLARISVEWKDYEAALSFIERSLIRNYHSHSARHIKVVVLRKLGRTEEAFREIELALHIDPFNYGCLFEKYLLEQELTKAEEARQTAALLHRLSRGWEHNYIEYAFDYAHAGLYAEASMLLHFNINNTGTRYPMIYYYLGWLACCNNEKDKALAWFTEAAALPPGYCFPNRIEDIVVLQKALECNPHDAKAFYYLGNLWYDKKQYDDAIACWEQSAAIDDTFPTVHRNLALAYYNKRNDAGKAVHALEKAFALNNSDARVLMELDQLYKNINTAPGVRLAHLEQYPALVHSRDDLYLEKITLFNQSGRYEEARQMMERYRFHPWEGGEGKTVKQFLIATIELAKAAIENGKGKKALQLLNETDSYPPNLGEGKLYGTPENDILYLKGMANELMGDEQAAAHCFTLATQGIAEPVQAIFYNDPQPDKIFYQGLAWRKLQQDEKGIQIFRNLAAFGEAHMNDKITIDYFAVSLPDLLVFETDLDKRNKTHCLYMSGLGYLGLGGSAVEKAVAYFSEVLRLDKNHQGAAIHMTMANIKQSI